MRVDSLTPCGLCARRDDVVQLKRLAETEYADVLICKTRHNKVRTVSAQVRSSHSTVRRSLLTLHSPTHTQMRQGDLIDGIATRNRLVQFETHDITLPLWMRVDYDPNGGDTESGGGSSTPARPPQAPPQMTAALERHVRNLETLHVHAAGAARPPQQSPLAEAAVIGRALRRSVAAALEDDTLAAFIKSLTRALTKSSAQAILPLMSGAAALRTKAAPSERAYDDATGQNAQLLRAIAEAIASASAVGADEAAEDELALGLSDSSIHNHMAYIDWSEILRLDLDDPPRNSSPPPPLSPLPVAAEATARRVLPTPLEELLIAGIALDDGLLLNSTFTHAETKKHLGRLITTILSKQQNEIDELCLVVKVCGSVSTSVWDEAVRPILRIIADSMECNITVKTAAQLKKMGQEHVAVRAVIDGQLSTEYSPSGGANESDTEYGVVFQVKQQLKQKLENSDEMKALTTTGAIGATAHTGRGSSRDNPVWVVGAGDQARIKTAAGIDRITIADTAIVLRFLGSQASSPDQTMPWALYRGDDDKASLEGHGKCDGSCPSQTECRHLLAQMSELRETISITLECGRKVWVKLIKFIVDGKSYRTILQRKRGAAGWAVAWLETSSCTKQQILFMPFMGTSAAAQAAAATTSAGVATTTTAAPTAVDDADALPVGDAASAAAALDAEKAGAAAAAAAAAASAALGEAASRLGQSGDSAKVDAAAAVLRITKEELLYIHFYAAVNTHNESNRTADTAPYCTGNDFTHFPPSMTVHGRFTVLLRPNFSPKFFSQHFLLISLLFVRTSFSFSPSHSFTHRHCASRHRRGV